MNKKSVLVVLLLALATAPIFSFGIGGSFGLDIVFGDSVGPGALLSL